uniref:ankyrin repeat and SOCS box protein 2-like isoform X5 n=1 Tax=Solea senegalensis TaxID=28829 RepID=UPI001CD8AF96|nr:ankyrin repeat and SOCS box protein 2-like isoform X5 [Solea senegalensis]
MCLHFYSSPLHLVLSLYSGVTAHVWPASFVVFCLFFFRSSSIMAADPGDVDDYSLYSDMNDDQLLQLAIERSLSDTRHSNSNTTNNSVASSVSVSRLGSNDPPVQTMVSYSSPNPPSAKPPDLETFDGTVSCFMTGSGKKMMAYRRADGTLVYVTPAPEEEEEPLFKAIRVGDVSRVKSLVMSPGANLMLSNKPDWLALHQAAWYGQHSCLSVLLSAQPGMVNKQTENGESALLVAVSKVELRCVQVLLENGADPDIANNDKETPLFKGADINSQAADGATALYEAAKNRHQETVELLLSQNADANKPGKTGLLPLHIAAQTGSDTIVSMLIPVTSKARVWRTGISPLHVAAERNRDNVLEALIEAGFDVNTQLSEERSRLYEDRRSTALYFSVINNNVDAVRMLLEAGADPNLDMFKPLMVAARQGCIQTVTLLVEHGADINACIPTHPTTFPAVFMFSMKYLPMFKYLLDHGGHALSCFDCLFGNQPHPPIKPTRSEREHPLQRDTQLRRGVQFCEMISAPSICRWAGPIIDVLLDYVGHVTLCSRLLEHLDSYSEWSSIKEKAASPRSLMQLCRLNILQLVGQKRLKKLPLPGSLTRFLQHKEGVIDDEE